MHAQTSSNYSQHDFSCSFCHLIMLCMFIFHCSLSSCFSRVISFHDQRERVLNSLLFHPNHHIQASNTHEYLNTFPLSPFSFWLKVCVTKAISPGNINCEDIYIEHLARLLSPCNSLFQRHKTHNSASTSSSKKNTSDSKPPLNKT